MYDDPYNDFDEAWRSLEHRIRNSWKVDMPLTEEAWDEVIDTIINTDESTSEWDEYERGEARDYFKGRFDRYRDNI